MTRNYSKTARPRSNMDELSDHFEKTDKGCRTYLTKSRFEKSMVFKPNAPPRLCLVSAAPSIWSHKRCWTFEKGFFKILSFHRCPSQWDAYSYWSVPRCRQWGYTCVFAKNIFSRHLGKLWKLISEIYYEGAATKHMLNMDWDILNPSQCV